MCSPKMRDANRRNALKSTGPKTPEGKARSSQNAVTHGLSARATVVLDESVEEFDAFAQGIRDDLRPRGAMENVLVDRIIHITWKLRRVPKAEAASFTDHARRRVRDAGQPEWTVAQLMQIETNFASNSLMRLQMFEARLDRALQSTMRQFERLRKMRLQETDDVQAEPCTPGGNPDADIAQSADESHVASVQNEPVLMEQTDAPSA